jgi:tRNA pseudouridine55 synthase
LKAELQNVLNGILVVDKPVGPTSFDMIRRLRRVTGQRKMGHTGTLDPMASGVLPICLGQGTKLIPYLEESVKEYSGRMILGLTTDTDDITGRVTGKKTRFDLSHPEIIRTTEEFVGAIEQVAPAYSAVKINGRPAYDLARRGQKVPARSRQVTIHDLTVTKIDLPYISFCARVSKGTYIRSLAADLGRRLRTGACLESLRRLSSGPFSLGKSFSVEHIEDKASAGRLEELLIPMDMALSFMPEIVIPDIQVAGVLNGRPLPIGSLPRFSPIPGLFRIRNDGMGLLAIYKYNPHVLSGEDDCLLPLRVLGRK